MGCAGGAVELVEVVRFDADLDEVAEKFLERLYVVIYSF